MFNSDCWVNQESKHERRGIILNIHDPVTENTFNNLNNNPTFKDKHRIIPCNSLPVHE